MMLTADDAAAKGWWTWAIKHGKPTLPETADMKKLLQRWEKEAGPKLEEAALKGKPSQVQKELEPFKELRDHWQLCLVELILAERKGLYEGAREAFFRPFKVDDSTRTRRDYRTMKHTTTLYVELLLKRGAVSEAGRIVSFMNRRYSLDNHTLAFEAAMVKDAEEELNEAFRLLALSLKKNRNAKAWLNTDGLTLLAAKDLFPNLRQHEGWEEFLASPTRFLKKLGLEAIQ